MFIQNQKPPTNQIISFNYNKFNLGLNNVDSPFRLEEGETPNSLNVMSFERGVLETRPGTFKFISSQLGTEIQAMFRYQTDSFDYILASSTTKLYKIDLSDDTVAELLTVNDTVSGIQKESKFYFVDGAKFREYDGTDIFEIIDPLGSETKGTVTYVGSPTFTATYRPTDNEVVDEFKGSNNINDIKKCTMITLHQKNNRLYFAGNPDYPNIVFSTDIDNVYYVPTNNYLPPITNDNDDVNGIYSFNDVMVIFKSRTIFALYGNDYSDYDFKEVTVNCGPINKNVIQKVNNYLYYLGSDGSVYSLYDVRTDYKKLLTIDISQKLNFAKSPINVLNSELTNSTAFFYDKFYILKVGDKTLIHSIDFGWYLFDGVLPTAFIKIDNDLIITDSSKYLFRWTINRPQIIEESTAILDQTDFTVSKGYLNELNDDAIVYVDDVETTAAKVDNQTFRIAACSGGETVKVEYLSLKSYNDNGVAIDCYWKSGQLDYGSPSRIKQLRKVYLTASSYKWFDSSLTFNVYMDYFKVGSGIELSTAVTLWGVSLFGDLFINQDIIDPVPIPVNRRGKIIQYEMESDDIDKPFRIYNIHGDLKLRNNYG